MKQIIYTDKSAYERAKDNRNRKLKLFEELGKEFHELTGETPKDNLLRADAWGLLKNTILANYKTPGGKQLSFEKTCDLYEINIYRFRELAKDYRDILIDETKEVNIDHFQTFAENEAQKKAFNEINELIDRLDKAKETYGLFRSIDGLCSSLVPLVQFDLGGRPIPSVTFIKSLK